VPKYDVLSTLPDHGLKIYKEKPGRLAELNPGTSRKCARGLE
jgi:hypothetical protein